MIYNAEEKEEEESCVIKRQYKKINNFFLFSFVNKMHTSINFLGVRTEERKKKVSVIDFFYMVSAIVAAILVLQRTLFMVNLKHVLPP